MKQDFSSLNLNSAMNSAEEDFLPASHFLSTPASICALGHLPAKEEHFRWSKPLLGAWRGMGTWGHRVPSIAVSVSRGWWCLWNGPPQRQGYAFTSFSLGSAPKRKKVQDDCVPPSVLNVSPLPHGWRFHLTALRTAPTSHIPASNPSDKLPLPPYL